MRHYNEIPRNLTMLTSLQTRLCVEARVIDFLISMLCPEVSEKYVQGIIASSSSANQFMSLFILLHTSFYHLSQHPPSLLS